MVTAVMAQPAEPTVSVVELPKGADAHAPSCWLIAGIVIELSATATTGAPNMALRAIAPASVAARRRGVTLGNLTEENLGWTAGQTRPILRPLLGANKRPA